MPRTEYSTQPSDSRRSGLRGIRIAVGEAARHIGITPAIDVLAPMNGSCRLCGAATPGELCDTCVDAELARQAALPQEALVITPSAGKKSDTRILEWKRICPALMADTDLSRLPVGKPVIDSVLRWQMGARGLLLHGATGRGKTRLVWKLLERLYVSEGFEIAAFPSAQNGYFDTELGLRYGAEIGDAPAWIKYLTEVEVLFLDDFDKLKLTERIEAEIFRLIDMRALNMRPSILTTNAVGTELSTRMTGNRSDPFFRRLTDFFTPIHVH